MQDSIKKTIEIAAPIDEVWQALTDHEEFGAWFEIKLASKFEVGQVTYGEMSCEGWEGTSVWFKTTTMDAPTRFCFRWPYEAAVTAEDAENPSLTTLVEFTLEKISSGTRLTVLESGFNSLPEDRRVQAFRDNTGGWEVQTNNIRNYVEKREVA